MSESIFTKCRKCDSTILTSEKSHHRCLAEQIKINPRKQSPNYGISNKHFDSFKNIYSELGKIISYRIMPECDHDVLLQVLEKLVYDVKNNKNRTIDEECFKVLQKVKRPMSAKSITAEINSMYGFPIRKVEDVSIALSGNRKVFENNQYSEGWILKDWEIIT